MFLNLCASILILATAHGFPSETNDKRCLNCCSDGGICVVEGEVPQCYCLPEWSGQRCDQPRALKKKTNDGKTPLSRSTSRNTACSMVQGLCDNGGACRYDSINQEYSCECSDDYYGDRCENTSPCLTFDICQNGGLCKYDSQDERVTCTCKPGFSGDLCEIASATTLDPVCARFAPKFCNGGSCRIEKGVPKCICPANKYPPFCTTSTPATQPSSTAGPGQPTTRSSSPGPQLNKTCRDNPCQNGGTCFNTGNNYYCYCSSRYTGYDCETRKP